MSIDKNNLPLHVAITMDGNGRWATERKLPRTSGHEEGLKISKKIALHKLAIFLTSNSGIFGLNKKDEDFKSEVVLLLLERGENILDQFNPEYGTFSTYSFCFIKSLMNIVNRKQAAKNIQEFHNISESITEKSLNSQSNPLFLSQPIYFFSESFQTLFLYKK